MQRSSGPPESPETTYVNANLNIWIQSGKESWQANAMLLEIVQQLRAEMTNLRMDNEWMCLEHEIIIRIMSNR